MMLLFYMLEGILKGESEMKKMVVILVRKYMICNKANTLNIKKSAVIS